MSKPINATYDARAAAAHVALSHELAVETAEIESSSMPYLVN
ncbi:hypothetical protein M2368_003174 [Arthrobacter sp. JUb119]|nr:MULTISPECIES: hypothetical protein [unclassified Arthrobacter]MCS3494146.1 hypothetical protein [Arthrobacter sp. JUb119]